MVLVQGAIAAPPRGLAGAGRCAPFLWRNMLSHDSIDAPLCLRPRPNPRYATLTASPPCWASVLAVGIVSVSLKVAWAREQGRRTLGCHDACQSRMADASIASRQTTCSGSADYPPVVSNVVVCGTSPKNATIHGAHCPRPLAVGRIDGPFVLCLRRPASAGATRASMRVTTTTMTGHAVSAFS